MHITSKKINGVKVNLLHLDSVDVFHVEVISNVGAQIEKTSDKNIFGLSHLVEHLSFKSTKDYDTDTLNQEMKRFGLSNAFTSKNEVGYWYKTISKHADVGVELCFNFAFNNLQDVTEDEYVLEKDIVLNEIRQYNDDDQTMFHLNIEAQAFGHTHEYNVLGSVESVSNTSLQDAIDLKNLFLNKEHNINVMFNPSLISEERLTNLLLGELKRFGISGAEKHDVKVEELTFESTILDNASEQTLVSIIIDTDHDAFVSKSGNYFLSTKSEHSLNDLIREKNGLTYGIHMASTKIAGKNRVMFTTDVKQGNEEKLIDLFKESIQLSCDSFSKEAHTDLIQSESLMSKLSYVDVTKFKSTLNLAMNEPELFEELPFTDSDLNKTLDHIFDVRKEYSRVNEYIQDIKNKVTNGEYKLISNRSW